MKVKLMGRHSCIAKQKLKKGLWSPEEDEKLYDYIAKFGVGCWSSVPKLAGLQRCGKSCRLRWINYLRPNLKRGVFSQEEEDMIISLHKVLGNRWAQIAAQLPGRTDNEIKNFWNSSLKKKLMKQGIDPTTHKPLSDQSQLKSEKNCSEQLIELPNMSTSAEASKDQFVSQQVFDPMFVFQFQENVNSSGYNSKLLAQFQQNLSPYDHHHNQFEGNCSNYGFCSISMPSLTNFETGHMTESEFSDSSNSRMSSFLISEAKESSSNSSNINSYEIFSGVQMNRVESLFQYPYNEIKNEEVNPSSWEEERELHNHSEGDFSNYPLSSVSDDLSGANLDNFHEI